MTEHKTAGGDTETDIFSKRTQLKPYEYNEFLDYKDA
ncbi:MAG: ribonucleotide reductase, partial [Candidatus Aminicenantes bacterium]